LPALPGKAQDRIERGVYFAANARVIDNCILRQILYATERDFAFAFREDVATPIGPGSQRQRNQEHRVGGADGDRQRLEDAFDVFPRITIENAGQ